MAARDLYAIQFVGPDTYNGYDQAAERHIEVASGEVIAVSADKRRQLLADFPTQWRDLGSLDPVTSEDSAANVVHVEREEPARARVPRRRKPANPDQEKA